MSVRDNSHVKAAGNWTAEGARETFQVRNDAQVKINDTYTTTDITRRYNVYDGGTLIKEAEGESVDSIPRMSGTPDTIRDGNTGTHAEWVVFDLSDNTFKGYDGSSWIPLS